MRFRCLMTEIDHIQALMRVLQAFCRFAQSFYVRLSDTDMQLITDRTHSCSPFLVKCDLKCQDFFDEHHFSGINSQNNLIYFQIKSDPCTHVLSSLSPIIKSLRLKLANAQVGCVLSLAVEYPSHDSGRSVCHQIKVDIIRTEFWNDICQQNFTDSDISIHLLDGRVLCAMTERLANFSQYVDMTARKVRVGHTRKALITVNVQSDSITIKNKLSNLDLNTNQSSHSDDTNDDDDTGDQLVQVRVDIRKINLLFNTLKQLKQNAVICDISDKTRIYFRFSHNGINFEAVIANIEP